MFVIYYTFVYLVFFFKQKTAYDMRISDWSSDVCSSDLPPGGNQPSDRRWTWTCFLTRGQCRNLSDRSARQEFRRALTAASGWRSSRPATAFRSECVRHPL